MLQPLRWATPDNLLSRISLSTQPPAQLRIDPMARALEDRLDVLRGQHVVTLAQRMDPLGPRR